MKHWSLLVLLLCIANLTNAQIIDKVKGAFIAKTSLSSEDLADLEINNVDYSKIVVYTSEEISIQRNIPRDVEVFSNTEGNVVYDNGKEIDKITIVKGASGMITEVVDDSIKVKFEDKEGYEFTFVKDHRGTDHTSAYYLKVSDDRTIEYGPYEWYLNWGRGVNIQWKAKEITRSVATKKRVRGIKPDGTKKKSFKELFVSEDEDSK